MGEQKILVEPFIEGNYAKFNSNSGWVNKGYAIMQALQLSLNAKDGVGFGGPDSDRHERGANN